MTKQSGWIGCDQSVIREDLLEHCQAIAKELGVWHLSLERVVEWTDTEETWFDWVSGIKNQKSWAIYYPEQLGSYRSWTIAIGPTLRKDKEVAGAEYFLPNCLIGHEFAHALVRSQRSFYGYTEGRSAKAGAIGTYTHTIEEGAAEIVSALLLPTFLHMQGIPMGRLGEFTNMVIERRCLNNTYTWQRVATNILFGLINQSIKHEDLYEARQLPATFDIDIMQLVDLAATPANKIVTRIAEEIAQAQAIPVEDAAYMTRNILELAKPTWSKKLSNQQRFYAMVRAVDHSGIDLRATSDHRHDLELAILEDQALAVA